MADNDGNHGQTPTTTPVTGTPMTDEDSEYFREARKKLLGTPGKPWGVWLQGPQFPGDEKNHARQRELLGFPPLPPSEHPWPRSAYPPSRLQRWLFSVFGRRR